MVTASEYLNNLCKKYMDMYHEQMDSFIEDKKKYQKQILDTMNAINGDSEKNEASDAYKSIKEMVKSEIEKKSKAVREELLLLLDKEKNSSIYKQAKTYKQQFEERVKRVETAWDNLHKRDSDFEDAMLEIDSYDGLLNDIKKVQKQIKLNNKELLELKELVEALEQKIKDQEEDKQKVEDLQSNLKDLDDITLSLRKIYNSLTEEGKRELWLDECVWTKDRKSIDALVYVNSVLKKWTEKRENCKNKLGDSISEQEKELEELEWKIKKLESEQTELQASLIWLLWVKEWKIESHNQALKVKKEYDTLKKFYDKAVLQRQRAEDRFKREELASRSSNKDLSQESWMVNEDSGENMTKNEMLEKIISELNMSVSEKKLRRMLKSRKKGCVIYKSHIKSWLEWSESTDDNYAILVDVLKKYYEIVDDTKVEEVWNSEEDWVMEWWCEVWNDLQWLNFDKGEDERGDDLNFEITAEMYEKLKHIKWIIVWWDESLQNKLQQYLPGFTFKIRGQKRIELDSVQASDRVYIFRKNIDHSAYDLVRANARDMVYLSNYNINIILKKICRVENIVSGN